MKNLGLKSILASLALSAGLASANAAVVYSDNATDNVGLLRGVSTLTTSFFSGGGAKAISFDLFGAKSVDGAGNGYDDVFTINVNGTDVFSGSFDMGGGGTSTQLSNTVGWVWTSASYGWFLGGLTTVSGAVNLIAGLNTFSVTFSSPFGGNQGLGDESWALNDLDISAVPLPAGAPLLLAGLGGLALLRRKRAAK